MPSFSDFIVQSQLSYEEHSCLDLSQDIWGPRQEKESLAAAAVRPDCAPPLADDNRHVVTSTRRVLPATDVQSEHRMLDQAEFEPESLSNNSATRARLDRIDQVYDRMLTRLAIHSVKWNDRLTQMNRRLDQLAERLGPRSGIDFFEAALNLR